MKSLLYKDLHVMWKQMRSMVFMVVIFCLVPMTSLYLNSFFVAYAGILVPISLMSYDERAKWDALAAMMPYSTRDLVLSRYVIAWGCTAFASVFWLLGQQFFSPGRQLTQSSLTTLLLLVSGVAVLLSVAFPFLFRLGTEKGRLYMIVGFMLIGVLIGGLSALIKTGNPLLTQAFLPAALMAAVLLSALSVKVSMGQYVKRAW